LPKRLPKYIIWLLFLLLFTHFSFAKTAKAFSLRLELYTDQEVYDVGRNITIYGTLNLDEAPVTDGLIAIQINEPDETLWLIRSLPTGTNATTKKWSLEVIDVTPTPSSSLNRGDMLGIRATIRNNDLVDRQTLLAVSLVHETGIPLKAEIIANITVQANKTQTYWFSNVLTIPNDAPIGVANVYLSLISNLPAEGGWSWGLDGVTTITIGSSSKQSKVEYEEGVFVMNVRTKNMYAKLGNYTVHASTLYIKPPYVYARARASVVFKVLLIGDITGPGGQPDGKVDIRDVSLVAYSFGSYPGHPKWNPIADLNGDNKVNILDISIVASDYGKIGILP